MDRKIIPVTDFTTRPHAVWDWSWFLLTSGDYAAGHYNSMTVSWGALGFIWDKPFALVLVRPTRYTYEFINQYVSFTLCAFDKSYRKALSLLGSQSGRNGDKLSASGLTAEAASQVAAPAFAEAELVLECRKLYWQDLDHSHFVDPGIEKFYNKDYHRMFFGDVVAVQATEKYV